MSDAISSATLLERLRESRLLTEDQLQRIGPVDAAVPPHELLQRIVAARWLSPYQARAIEAGDAPLWVGPYELLQPLQRGRSGWLFQVRKQGSDALATLKIYPRKVFQDQDELNQWRRECHAAAAVSHAHLVAIHEIGGDHQQFWMAREYVPGRDAARLVARHGALPLAWACEVVRQTALALQFGFLQGLHHGHLQPSKLLLTHEDFQKPPHVMLLGLGFTYATRARQGDSTVTRLDQLPSGSAYLAPEIGLGTQGTSVQGDLFSLGVVLFELLTGELPWTGEDPLSVWTARFEQPPRAARELRPDLPEELAKLLDQLLARDPTRRLRTPGECAAALAAFCPVGRNEVAAPPEDDAISVFSGEATPAAPPESASSLTSLTSSPAVEAAQVAVSSAEGPSTIAPPAPVSLPDPPAPPVTAAQASPSPLARSAPSQTALPAEAPATARSRPQADKAASVGPDVSSVAASTVSALSESLSSSAESVVSASSIPQPPAAPAHETLPPVEPLRFDAKANDLLRRLPTTDLLTEDHVDQLRHLAGLAGRGTIDWFTLVEHAQGVGLLTRWQAEQVMAGRKEFRLGDFLLLAPRSTGDGTHGFIALHPKHGTVQVKLVPATTVLDQEVVSRLDREFRISAQVQHPRLLAAIDRGRGGQMEYLALEAVTGPSLAEVIEAKGPLPEPWACEVARQVAEALGALADHKLVHRHLCPDNILLASDDLTCSPEVKLASLGAVHTEDEELKGTCVTQAEEILGHADYLAPEQVRDANDVDPRADLFSLGCVLFHALAGEVPFPGNSPQERADVRLRTDAPKLSWIRDNLTADIEPVVARLLERNPDHRFQTAKELIEALKPLSLTEGLPPLPRKSLTDLQSASGGPAQPSPLAEMGDLAEFFEALAASELLSEPQLSTARKLTEGLTAPQLFANRLVDRGLLTRWQAARLLEGHTDYFVGRFKLLARISQGATTETFLAEDTQSPRQDAPRRVVVKVLGAGSGIESVDLNRFRRAGELLRQLESQQIVPVELLGEHQGRWYTVMPYLPGRNALEVLRRLVRLQVGWSCEIARQAAEGLADLADRGLVHRDLQPAHLHIPFERDPQAAPRVHVLGCGLMRPIGSQGDGSTVARAGDLVGTADYIAPEQAENPVAVDARADVYALGCTLYQLLTGRLPFDGPNAMARLTARFHAQPPDVRQLRTDVPEPLAAVLVRAMALEPAQRYQHPRELAAALAPFCEPLPSNLAVLKRSVPGAATAAASSSPLPPVRKTHDLLERLESLALLGDEAQLQVRKWIQNGDEVSGVARQLIAERMLTPWQVRQLLMGRREFFVDRYRLLARLLPENRSVNPAADDPDRLEGTFLAADPQGGTVVLRRLTQLQQEPAILAFFAGQETASGQLAHPGLAQILDAGHLADGAFVATEVVGGRSLQAIIDGLPEGQGMPIATACALAHQAAEALDHAQRRGVQHRNLRPSSLLVRLTNDDERPLPVVKLLDLGIDDVSRHWTVWARQTLTGGGSPPAMTLEYIAPEQMDETAPCDPASDVYALTSVLYEMLAGEAPFAGQEPLERITARLANRTPDVTSRRAEIPAELAAVVARGLERDPKKRYANVGQLARDLARFVPATQKHKPVPSAKAPRPAVDPSQTPGVDAFLQQVEISHLLTRDTIGAARQWAAECSSAKVLAERLVANGQLTGWQVAQLFVGQTDFYLGTYKLRACLGHGSSGTVYEAEDQHRNRVALKVLSPEHLDEAENVKRFLREGRVAQVLQHGNICAVQGTDRDGDRHFLIMEYSPGQDLKAWVAEHGPLPIPFAAECIRQAALGLDHAHKHGVVHRDIKPGNLMVAADDTASYPKLKITDLGVADIADGELKGTTVTKVNEILGTPDFMAPEQAQDPSRSDPRCDIYSLGCTLYYLLTGEPPFEGETPLAKLTARLKNEAPPLGKKRADVPVELQSIVAKLLQRDPERRYQSARDVALELEPFGLEAPSLHGSVSVAFNSSEVEAFYATLHRADLLPVERLQATRKMAVLERDPRAVAKLLVDEGLLSRWQARQLLDGRSEFRFGDYQLLDMIGRGATGYVYKALSPGGQTVALKVLNAELIQKNEALARFQREMRVVAELTHPNIVTAYDCGQMGDDYFIAMEYVAGRDLKTWLAQNGPLPVDWACDCIRQGAAGLQHAHSKGIVHRDIKPGNMLVVAQSIFDPPSCKLLDMGFANAAGMDAKRSPLTRADQLLGTPDYMSPEQAQDPTQADIRSDIYSLGCTLFRLITGRPPFPGDTPLEKLNARFRQDPPPLRLYQPEAPEALERIVMKMMARDPDERYQQPSEVYHALKPFCMPGSPESPLDNVGTPVAPQDEDVAGDDSAVKSFRNQLAVFVGTTALIAAVLLYVFLQPSSVAGLASLAVALIGVLAVSTLFLIGPGSTSEAPIRRKRLRRSVPVDDLDTVVDLLAAVHPEQDALDAPWARSQGGLVSPADPYARLQLPGVAPEHYALRLVVERIDGDAALAIGLVHHGRQCVVTIDGWGGTTSGLGLIAGRSYESNSTTFKNQVFLNRQLAEVVCLVDDEHIEVLVDGALLLEYVDAPEDLSLPSGWAVRDPRALFVGTHATRYRFHEIELLTDSADALEIVDDAPSAVSTTHTPASLHAR